MTASKSYFQFGTTNGVQLLSASRICGLSTKTLIVSLSIGRKTQQHRPIRACFDHRAKRTENYAKEWNKITFGNIYTQKNELMAEITLLDNLEEIDDCLPIHSVQKRELRAQLQSIVAEKVH